MITGRENVAVAVLVMVELHNLALVPFFPAERNEGDGRALRHDGFFEIFAVIADPAVFDRNGVKRFVLMGDCPCSLYRHLTVKRNNKQRKLYFIYFR